MIVVAKKLSVLQLFISRMPKMCAILQLVSAPLSSPIVLCFMFHCGISSSECLSFIMRIQPGNETVDTLLETFVC